MCPSCKWPLASVIIRSQELILLILVWQTAMSTFRCCWVLAAAPKPHTFCLCFCRSLKALALLSKRKKNNEDYIEFSPSRFPVCWCISLTSEFACRHSELNIYVQSAMFSSLQLCISWYLYIWKWVVIEIREGNEATSAKQQQVVCVCVYRSGTIILCCEFNVNASLVLCCCCFFFALCFSYYHICAYIELFSV